MSESFYYDFSKDYVVRSTSYLEGYHAKMKLCGAYKGTSFQTFLYKLVKLDSDFYFKYAAAVNDELETGSLNGFICFNLS